jgi:hypothetical protein
MKGACRATENIFVKLKILNQWQHNSIMTELS